MSAQTTKLTIASGTNRAGNSVWMAYRKGKKGRLSPKFCKYTDLIKWLQTGNHI